jgi:L-alanine-DL-glutamate epimerase-like enolase superfamily enzyme
MTSPKPVIEAVDFFYLSMPHINLDVDGSQDALLVRVRSNNDEGWGECEAAPLPSIAAFFCPPSHGACLPVADAVIGAPLATPADIDAIYQATRVGSERLAQAIHVLSGIEIACWDLLGKRLEEPVWALLGQNISYPKTAYASLLFGETPSLTLEKARHANASGYRAAKFGWGPFGKHLGEDRDQLMAAREGLGPDALLLVDAGCIWRGPAAVEDATRRREALVEANVHWLEEPFPHHDRVAYRDFANQCPEISVAGGESAVNEEDALALMHDANLRFLQIDAGCIGGLGPSRRLATAANVADCQFVNHTFTSDLALAASLAPFADNESEHLAEYPEELSELGAAIAGRSITPNTAGKIQIPDRPGIGVDVDTPNLLIYQRSVNITIDDEILYQSPPIFEDHT